MTIGKYKGKTFKEIFEEDKGYADWVIATVNESGGKTHPTLGKFAKFLNQEFLKKGLKVSAETTEVDKLRQEMEKKEMMEMMEMIPCCKKRLKGKKI